MPQQSLPSSLTDLELDAVGALDITRYDRIIAGFRERFGRAPSAVADAPGRVNLIGGHTDYNALPVLPMAIDRSILVAVAPRTDRSIHLQNLDPRYPSCRYAAGPDIAPSAAGAWDNYHKAVTMDAARAKAGTAPRDGADVLVEGDIPPAAGLASSAALVVASALAYLALGDAESDGVLTLAERLAGVERYVGTETGGMDQAVSLLAVFGHALRIDFQPLRARPVPFPPELVIIACHSLVDAEKSGRAGAAYNRRVLECRLSCLAAASSLGRERAYASLFLRDWRRELDDDERLLAVIADAIGETDLTLSDAAGSLALGEGELVRLGAREVDGATRLAPFRRARHVLAEAARVDCAEHALAARDLPALGRLMAASQQSLRDDYEVSCAELDELVERALDSGAIAARLTGAGFGGCTVNLVPESEHQRFIAALDRTYYCPRLGSVADLSAVRLVLRLRGGARFVRMS